MECIRCCKPLESQEDILTGVCCDCWTDEDGEILDYKGDVLDY